MDEGVSDYYNPEADETIEQMGGTYISYETTFADAQRTSKVELDFGIKDNEPKTVLRIQQQRILDALADMNTSESEVWAIAEMLRDFGDEHYLYRDPVYIAVICFILRDNGYKSFSQFHNKSLKPQQLLSSLNKIKKIKFRRGEKVRQVSVSDFIYSLDAYLTAISKEA